MRAMMGTVDFGAPVEDGKRHFYVSVPEDRNESVSIVEYFGLDAEGVASVCRVRVNRAAWNRVRDLVKKDFNRRLKENYMSCGVWRTGKIKLDRHLGRELCVLCWAMEHVAHVGECAEIGRRWKALRPEERWWLFQKTVAEAGRDCESRKGWRKALYFALSDSK